MTATKEEMAEHWHRLADRLTVAEFEFSTERVGDVGDVPVDPVAERFSEALGELIDQAYKEVGIADKNSRAAEADAAITEHLEKKLARYEGERETWQK